MTAPRGADKADWLHFALMLDLEADLLPVVPDKGAQPGPFSRIKEFGKIPSTYDSEGYANGIKDWQNREIKPVDVERWSADRRLSMCLRTGRSGVYAIDVDIEDEEQAKRIEETIERELGFKLPKRVRSNSNKFLLAFRLKE